ncbi:MAG: translation initiation factor IF-3 [Christensenellales bacterium]
MNHNINDSEVRLIDEKGVQLGVMSKAEAQRIADYRNLDLVKVSPNAKPVVCKLMDYGKYRFDMIKKEKEAKKAQKVVEIKEIRLSQTIDIGDLKTKAKRAKEFLEDGNKVRVTLKMWGRQLAHTDISVQVVYDFYEMIKDYGVMETRPSTEGRIVGMTVAPIKNKNK